ncbi:MAG: hypothetical protein ACLPV8_12490 [Steroidobacteraceae bacterium]
MARYLFAVDSNPAEGREQEYNDWYSNRHRADLLALPGVVSARRFVLADAQLADVPHPFKYLALYEVETDDLHDFIGHLLARAGTEAMPISTALSSGTAAILWKELKGS